MCSARAWTHDHRSNFGPTGTVIDARLTSDPSRGNYTPACNVTVAHRQLECVTTPGVGQGLRWIISVAARPSLPSSAASAYTRPGLQYATGNTGLPTLGGAAVTLIGSDFGPAGGTVNVSCVYAANPSQVGFLANPFSPPLCAVIDDGTATCLNAPGFGQSVA